MRNSQNKKKLCLMIFIFQLMIGNLGFAKVGEVLKVLDSPGQFPTGLTFDGFYLWVADRKTDQLYQLDPNTGKQIKKLPAPGYSPTGLAWDGSHLWTIDDKENYLYRINVQNGVAERIIEAYTRNPKDIAWDGKVLWIADDKLHIILSIDTEDGMMISNFPAPSDNPDGLTFDGKYLWITDRGNNKIYRVVPQTGQVIAVLNSPEAYPRGLAWANGTLWNVDYQSDNIYQIKIDDSAFLSQLEPKNQLLENTFDFRNYGPGEVTSLDVYIAIPENRDNQQLLEPVSFEPKATDILTDQWGQKVAHFHINSLASGKLFRATMSVKAKIFSIEYYLDPDKVGGLEDISKEITEKYLIDGKKLMIHDPFMQNLARQIVGEERNPYWIARKIYDYLIDHLSYNLKPVGGWNTAPTVLKRGTASCSEYSFSFIALCRAVGLPARYVGTISLRGDDASYDEVFHRWCEVYLPNYGWIPFDANKGDKTSPADQAAGIGDVDCRYVITTTSGGDSKYLDWTYNFNYRWQSAGKCRVYSEQYGEWQPLKEK